MNKILSQWLLDFGASPEMVEFVHWALVILGLALLITLVNLLCRKVLIPIVGRLTRGTRAKWDDVLLSKKLLTNFSHLFAPIIIATALPMAFDSTTPMLEFLLKVNSIYLIVVVANLACSILNALYELSSHNDKLKSHPLKGVYQMLKIVVVCITLIIIVSVLIDKNPGYILTALGASAAVLMLVFKDMIMGLVAGVQLSANDMLRPGDWISMPKYGADGDVIEVTLTTVKVQNWDKTITTIPPYVLVSDSFQNWRGMEESGGRRIKRSVYIDMRSISFVPEDKIKEFKEKGLLDNIDRDDNLLVNLHVFRNYLESYLRHHPRVNKRLTIMVRQLQPTAQGLPLELYFFYDGTTWIPYEHLQAEIFEHVFAMLPTFGLRVFQAPMGVDFCHEETRHL